MSLTIHTLCKEGLVVVSDTRTTCRDNNGHVRYVDTTEKIVPFPNDVVVSYCGDNDIKADLTVFQFLCDLRRKIGNRSTIDDLPLAIMTFYVKYSCFGDVTFVVSGVIEGLRTCCTYFVYPKSGEIHLSMKPFQYGASYKGITNIAQAIMNSGIDYGSLSMVEAIDLTKGCMIANLSVFRYNRNPVVGGECRIYVINMTQKRAGWLQNDGVIMSDKDAPSDALLQYEKRQRDRILKEVSKGKTKLKG